MYFWVSGIPGRYGAQARSNPKASSELVPIVKGKIAGLFDISSANIIFRTQVFLSLGLANLAYVPKSNHFPRKYLRLMQPGCPHSASTSTGWSFT